MNICRNTLNNIGGKIKILLSFVFMLFLSSCGRCLTIRGYESEGIGNNCFFCPLYEVLTKSGADAAKASWNIVADAAQPLVCIVIAIYIAGYTLKMVASMGQQTFADYLSADKKGVLFLAFKAGVIVLLLGKDNFMATNVIAPLLEGAGNVGIGLADLNLDGGSSFAVKSPNLNTVSPWDGVFKLMNDIAKGFNDMAYVVVAIGKSMICNSTEGFILAWEWTLLAYGLAILLFGWMVCIGVCYFLVDVIINIICASVLLPLGIAMAISEKTMPHSKNIWNLFVNTFCSCLFLGAVLSLAIAVIEVNTGGDELYALLDSNQTARLNYHLKETGSFFLMIISMTLLVKVVESIKDLAKKLSSTSGLSSAGSKTLTPISDKAMKGGMRLAKDAGKNVGHVAARITHLDELATWGKNRVNARIGFLTGAGPQGYKAFWRPEGKALARKTVGNIVSTGRKIDHGIHVAVGFLTGLGPEGHRAFWR